MDGYAYLPKPALTNNNNNYFYSLGQEYVFLKVNLFQNISVQKMKGNLSEPLKLIWWQKENSSATAQHLVKKVMIINEFKLIKIININSQMTITTHIFPAKIYSRVNIL